MHRFLIISLMLLVATRAGADLLFVGDFEKNDLERWIRKKHCCEDTVGLVGAPLPVRAGRCSVRHILRKGDSIRAELRPPIQDFGKFENGREYWLGWSVYLPKDWVADELTTEIIFQLHTSRDYRLGEDFGRKPTFAFEFQKGGQYRLYNRSDPNLITKRDEQGNVLRPELYYALAGPTTGAWTDYAMHLLWSWEDDGLTELYRNGEIVVRRQGPNNYNDEQGPYIKFGVYKHAYGEGSDIPTTGQARTIYYDEMRIGDAKSSLAEVSPPAASPNKMRCPWYSSPAPPPRQAPVAR